MVVLMMTILALLPHISLAMEQNSSGELVEVGGIQYKKGADQESLEELPQEIYVSGMSEDNSLLSLESLAYDEGMDIGHLLEDEVTENLENTLLRSLAEDSDEENRLIVYNATELQRVFTHGDATGGNSNWSGERVVYLAFEDLEGSIVTASPPRGSQRIILLRSLDGEERNLTADTGTGDMATHFQIGNGNRVILDDENLHLVGYNVDEKVDGPVGGGLRIDDGGVFVLRSGTLRNMTSSWVESPIIVRTGGIFTMEGGAIRNNRSNAGGAIMVLGGTFELYDGSIYENYATQYGGSIEVTGAGTLNMYGGAIRNNYAQWYGGGLELNLFSTFNMYGGEIVDNIAAGDGGGGLRMNGTSLFNMFDGLIHGNKVTSDGRFPYGGGVAVYNNSTFNMNGGTISNNTSHRGGGVAVWEGIFNMGTGHTTFGRAPADQTGPVGHPVIIGNQATGGGLEHNLPVIGYGGGGGVFVYGKNALNGNANFIMHSGLITENTTAYRGGGVFVNSAEFQMRGGEISNNRTTENHRDYASGGGVYLHDNNWLLFPANFLMTGGVIRDNFSRDGGGIARNNEFLTIRISGDSIISGNIAKRLGGGIHTHTPAPESSGINLLSIGQNRGNFITASTVRFERNRSLMAVSRGLTVGQVRTNHLLIHNSVQWMGKNSVNGVYTNDSSFHLFNNHDVSNLQGTPILEESFDSYWITEKHVDIYGQPIEEIADVQKTIANGELYTPTHPNLEGYEAVGYKWDEAPEKSGDDFELGFPEKMVVNRGRTIYFVYKEKGTDVMLIKFVTGDRANKIQSFEFTVYFMDKDEKPFEKGKEIQYAGGVLYESKGEAHDNGVLVLDEDGKGTIQLSHGQIIRLMDIPKDTWIRFVEEDDINYLVSYKDYIEEVSVMEHDTKTILVGGEERVFEFLNTRYEVQPLGVKGGIKASYLMAFAGVIITPSTLIAATAKKSKRKYKESIDYW